MKSDKVLDAKGLACPMPIVRTKKAMSEMKSGQVLELQTTDQGSYNDISAWVKSTNNELLKYDENNDVFTFWRKKK